jgi:hypothetical protein
MFENEMLRTMIEVNETAFNNSYNAVVAIQEESEKLMNAFMVNSVFMPKEGQEVIDQWVGLYHKGCQEYKKMMDDGFDAAKGLFKGQTKKATRKKEQS